MAVGERSTGNREERILGIIETARSKRPRFKDPQVTMAHGAGGKSTQTLIEGLLVPAFASEALDELGDAGTVSVDGTGLAMTTDTFVVRPIRFPGGSIGELAVNGTVNDLAAGRRPAAGDDPLADPRGGPRRRSSCAPRSRRSPPRPGRPASRSSPATPRSSSAATATRSTSTRPGSACSTIAPGSRRRRCGRATGCSSRGRSASTARRSCWPAGSSGLDAEVCSDTRPLWRAADALLEAAGPSLRCMRDATRGGVASVLNELARASGVAVVVREGDVPVRAGGRGRRRAARHRPDVRRQRGQDRRLRRARGR